MTWWRGHDHRIDMTTTEQKREKLLQLAKQRQSDRLPPHRTLFEFHNGYYECDYVSPWSISACNVEAELMLIGQDWASSEILKREPDEERRRTGQHCSSPTNTNLRGFLEHMQLKFGATYATNLFPFIKLGAKNAPIPFGDLVRCARTYAIPQICLGRRTFDAIRNAERLPRLEWTEAKTLGPHTRIGSVEIYGLPHPSPQGIINAGGKDAVGRIWERLGKYLRDMRIRDPQRS